MKSPFKKINIVLTFVLAFGIPTITKSETLAQSPQMYIPGLGEFMSAIQVRHAKLWFAAKGKNWPLAAYELGEIKETFEDVAKYQPEFKGKPIAAIIGEMTAQPIAQLEKAIESKNSSRFVRAYNNLTQACSACHQATDHRFISIQRPTFPPITNQRFNLGRRP